MKFFYRIIIISCIAMLGHASANASVNETERIIWDQTRQLQNKGLSTNNHNAFCGMADGIAVLAGGIDSEGNASDLVSIIKDNNTETTTLPRPIYGGASVFSADGLICIGGQDNFKCYPDVYFIRTSGINPSVETLPSLPVPLVGAAATIDGNTIYLAGGRTGITENDSCSSTLYKLDLKSPDRGWSAISSYNAIAQTGAVAVIQNNGVNPCLYIIGGENQPGHIAVFDLLQNKWKQFDIEGMPADICAAVPVAANHIFAITQESDQSGNKTLWKYHTVTNQVVKDHCINVNHPLVGLTRTGNGFSVLAADPVGTDLMILDATIHPVGEGLGAINILVIILYFVILAGIGIYFSRRQKNTDDYFKGGGRIPWWAAGLSLFGTALSAITFMAIPAKAYATDWSYALFNVGILLVAPIIVFVFIPYFRKLNITTAYQYLEIRFNSAIRVICSLAFIIYQVGRMGVVLFLPAIALNVVTGIDIFMCIGIMGVCSILYTMIGGIEAVVWTDAIQVIILLGGALFAVIYIACELPGGFMQTIQLAADANKFDFGSAAFDLKDATIWTVLIATCFTNLTTYGTDQSMVQRYLTTPSLKAAKKSVWTNAALTLPATILFFFIGTALYSYYSVYPEKLSVTIPNGDAIFPWYIFTELPAGVVGLLISGIFAAAMSTLSGSMNSAATAYVVDIYPKFFKERTPGLHTARISTLVIGTISLLFAFLMATWNVASLWDEFQKILGLILGSMGGLFMLGMLTRRANSSGAIVGIIVSMAVQFFIARFHTFHLLLYTASGFITCFVVGYIASFLFKASENK